MSHSMFPLIFWFSIKKKNEQKIVVFLDFVDLKLIFANVVEVLDWIALTLQ